MSFNIESNFFCIFKTGDNIVYNLRTLNYFYELYNQGDNKCKELLTKPIVIWLSSITEAVLHDFHLRIRANRIEGVSGLADDVLNYIRGRQIDEFEKYITSAKKHNFFDRKTKKFYNKLDDLRVIRNRIHIQNKKFIEPKDERVVFREEAKILAEKCAEIVLKIMSSKYERSIRSYVKDMYLPWDEHFPNLNI